MLTGTAVVFRLVALSHLLLLVALIVRDYRSDRSARVTVFFLSTVVGYLGAPLALHFALSPWWLWPLLLAGLVIVLGMAAI